MKKLFFGFVLVVFIFSGLSIMANEFSFHSFARAHYVQLAIRANQEDLRDGDIEAKIIIDSPFTFVPYLGQKHVEKTEEDGQWQVTFSSLLDLGSAVFYVDFFVPKLFKFEVRVLSGDEKIIHTLDVGQMSTILTISLEADAFLDFVNPIEEMDWAVLHYGLEYPDERWGFSWTLFSQEELVDFILSNQSLILFVEKRWCQKGGVITLSISGGHFNDGGNEVVLWSRQLLLPEDMSGEWEIEMLADEPVNNAVIPRDKITTTWGSIKR